MFLSYTHSDEARAKALAADLSRLGRKSGTTRGFTAVRCGGVQFVEQIQAAEVFLLALSDDYQNSRYCQNELSYAEALRIPVLPVQVGIPPCKSSRSRPGTSSTTASAAPTG